MPQPTLGPKRTVFAGRIFSVIEQDVHFPSGEHTIFEYCVRPPSVSVLAFNTNGELLLTREKRVGYGGRYTWFLPGGRMDQPGDTPRKAAMRELREETGFAAKTLQKISTKSPGSTLVWDIHIFAARDLYHSPLSKDMGEETRVHFIPFGKAVSMALDGTIENEFISYHIIRFDYMLHSKQFQWKT
jgi:8-oxo-dGTP pyrophosphatase MutT (NUDIX family)